MAADALLDAARAALRGDVGLPPQHQTRAAALLARTALEQWVDERLAAAGIAAPTSSMRVKLLCLCWEDDAEAALTATWAFSALSHACHHHAYELTPAHSEVEHLVHLVADL